MNRVELLPRIQVWLVGQLPFAALPVLLNLLVWLLVGRGASWPPFQVEDLCYFAILLSSETLLGLGQQGMHDHVRRFREAVFFLLVLATLAPACLLGFWNHEQAHPEADSLFAPEAQRILCVALGLAGSAFLISLIFQLVAQLDASKRVWRFSARVSVALLPILGSAFFGLLTAFPYRIFRVNDLSFFSIALTGPAIVDLMLVKDPIPIPRLLIAAPLILVTISSSMMLGFWYLSSAVPPEQGIRGELASTLSVSSAITAVFAFLLAALVGFVTGRRSEMRDAILQEKSDPQGVSDASD